MIFYYLEFLNNLMNCFIYIIIYIFGNLIFLKLFIGKIWLFIFRFTGILSLLIYIIKKKNKLNQIYFLLLG